jgi:hypothetical protein
VLFQLGYLLLTAQGEAGYLFLDLKTYMPLFPLTAKLLLG